MSTKKTVDAVLQERGARYGEFKDFAALSQSFLRVARGSIGWTRLNPHQCESLEMVLHKVARVLNGDPDYVDNWVDIAGYATLVARELPEQESTEAMSGTAVEPAGDGWIEWGGGGVTPVPVGTLVEVQFRNGLVQPGRALIDSGLRSPNWGRVDVQGWSSEQAFDIVRYRVLP